MALAEVPCGFPDIEVNPVQTLTRAAPGGIDSLKIKQNVYRTYRFLSGKSMTLLTGIAVDHAGWVSDANRDHFRATSYDLSIGEIIDSNGKKHNEFTLQPGEMAAVVSRESIQLPGNVTAIAHYLTRLTRKGIWAQTIGIVDPHWSGPLSTTVVNQSKATQILISGERYLRLTFFEHDETSNSYGSKTYARAEYLESAAHEAATYMPETFLNSALVVEQSAEKASKKLAEKTIQMAAVFAVFLAFLSVIMPFAVNSASKTYWDGFVNSTLAEVADNNNKINANTSALLERIAKLETELANLKNAPNEVVNEAN